MTNTNQAPETDEPTIVRTDEEVKQYENDLPF